MSKKNGFPVDFLSLLFQQNLMHTCASRSSSSVGARVDGSATFYDELMMNDEKVNFMKKIKPTFIEHHTDRAGCRFRCFLRLIKSVHLKRKEIERSPEHFYVELFFVMNLLLKNNNSNEIR